MVTKVYFIRHAEPDFDHYNDYERGLSDKGKQDRYLVSSFLKDKKIHAVFSSPYLRAVETVRPFAESQNLSIQLVDDFRERKITDHWIADFDSFARQQWQDFTYKLPDGESLKDVQLRNISALNQLLISNAGQNIVVGIHGTALSTIIHYYDNRFGYADFQKIKGMMPWIVVFTFDENRICLQIEKIDIFEKDM